MGRRRAQHSGSPEDAAPAGRTSRCSSVSIQLHSLLQASYAYTVPASGPFGPSKRASETAVNMPIKHVHSMKEWKEALASAGDKVVSGRPAPVGRQRARASPFPEGRV
jgi:hypothetical protein